MATLSDKRNVCHSGPGYTGLKNVLPPLNWRNGAQSWKCPERFQLCSTTGIRPRHFTCMDVVFSYLTRNKFLALFLSWNARSDRATEKVLFRDNWNRSSETAFLSVGKTVFPSSRNRTLVANLSQRPPRWSYAGFDSSWENKDIRGNAKERYLRCDSNGESLIWNKNVNLEVMA